MIYEGRTIDVLAVWGPLVDLPNHIPSPLPTFLPKVKCPNPEHVTDKAHFQINTRQPTVHCFARCGIQGRYEHAIAIVKGWYLESGKPDLKQARRFLLQHSRAAIGEEIQTAGSYGERKSYDYESALAVDQRLLDGGEFRYTPKLARAYLDYRGIDDASRGRWQLGWDEDAERVVIPAYDERGVLRFLIRHRIDGRGKNKYLYTPGAIKTNILFGACFAHREELDSLGLVLCEGPLDAVRLQQLGVPTAVSILGTGLSVRQVRIIDKLRPRRVYLFFDKDPSGVSNMAQALATIRGVPILICRYPSDKGDPAELTGKEARSSIKRALPIAQFLRNRQARSMHATTKGAGLGKKRVQAPSRNL